MTRRTILLIENDTAIQAVAKFCLEMDGDWQVNLTHCEEGLLKARAIVPDVILLDSLALDTEEEIITRLKSDKTTKSIPIILFTTKVLDSKQLENLNNSVVGTIYKPFDALTLSKNISNILTKKVELVGYSPSANNSGS